MARLRICFVTSELAPYAKTGGLADVSAALPRELHRLGHDVRVFLPFYPRVRGSAESIRPVEGLQNLNLRLGSHGYSYSVFATPLPRTQLDVHLVDCPSLYHRSGIYTGDGDEHRRFLLLTRAAIECCQRMQWSPDIFHCHDWQTALGPLYLKSTHGWDRLFEHTRSVLTLHNVGYQGVFGSDVLPDLGLGEAEHLLHQDDLRAGRIGFLKTGILHADLLTTVSPTYARELQTEAYGMGLHDLLRRRAGSLVGILNGIDAEEWNPRTDPHLAARYSEKSLWRKEMVKRQLLAAMGLPDAPEAPVVGLVSRLTGQKGIELLDPALPELMRERDLRFVALGSGESRYENLLGGMQAAFPGKACFYRGFSNELAHLIEGGADMFVMPSRYEPCGLNQMYSLRYGTVPVVRKTGGLADTVEHYDPKTGAGTGFVFEHSTSTGLRWALGQAFDVYPDRRAWRRLMQNGMARDFSWPHQAAAYEDLFTRLVAREGARS
ncbi:MAG TPA: glycogen synthase GlgA [Candidatus Limnocylindria bacterium]|nr:glycogen synthase GlgA [Candidatus Limnocylindria bacterium]